jgi:hypothetical protein
MRLEYNVEATQKEMRAARMPEFYIERLAHGR